MFYPVKCIDISRTGIAFFTEEALTTDQVIVALGTTEEAFYVRSRVANCAAVQDEDGWRFRVGCEFVERYGTQRGNAQGAAVERSIHARSSFSHWSQSRRSRSCLTLQCGLAIFRSGFNVRWWSAALRAADEQGTPVRFVRQGQNNSGTAPPAVTEWWSDRSLRQEPVFLLAIVGCGLRIAT